MHRLACASLAAVLLACGSTGGPPAGPPAPSGAPETPVPPAGPGWVVTAEERFDAALPAGAFAPDPVPDDGPFADAGAYFTARGVTPPAAYRASVPFGADGWLTAEAYTRRSGASLADQAAVVNDPADPANQVLRVASPAHTDALVVRPTAPLPARYRLSLRVGFARFGDGLAGLNGYDSGDERAGPWWPDALAPSQNGFYWVSILDAQPRPHNNTWIHHHRKLVIDSDNHSPPWMEIWDGQRFRSSGERPVMMIALDGSRPADEKVGNAFYSWAAGQWQPDGTIRAADRYLPGEWYRVTVERDGGTYTMEVSGRFEFGGETTYRATIDASARCVWHWPVDAAEAAQARGCEDTSGYPSAPDVQRWPAGGAWPDWFMFGDPHANYYEGQVLYDDVVLETWRE
ncbi:MAG: hypothetical protein QM767_24060 [Anaeromyxobacter sp.]